MWLLALAMLATADSASSFKLALSPTDSLYVESHGQGDPVVLIPGLFGSAFGFREVVPLIVEAGYRAVVIEPLGIGFSSRPDGADYSLLAQSERIATAVRLLGLEKVILIGHSLGGAEGFRMAYRHPDLVRGLLSIEGGPTEGLATPSFTRAMRFAPLLRLGGMRLVRRVIRGSLVKSSGDRTWVTDEVMLGYTAGPAQNLKVALRALSDMAHSSEAEALAPHLGEVVCPVLLMVGTAEHDSHVDPNEVVLLQRSLPDFAVDTVPGAGHFIQEEQPPAVLAGLERLVEMIDRGAAPR